MTSLSFLSKFTKEGIYLFTPKLLLNSLDPKKMYTDMEKLYHYKLIIAQNLK